MKLSTKYLILAAILLISIAGAAIAIYTTANGPWGYTDPVVYISTARSLDRGQGLVYYEADAAFRPITIEPPFYSIALGAIGLFGVNLVVATRWLNIAAFVASIFIAGWIFYRYSRVPALGIVASALMCIFPYMVWMFGSAYSEPLFVLTFLAGGWGLLAYLQKEKPGLLVLSALLIGLIPVTRYAGIAMVLAGGGKRAAAGLRESVEAHQNALLFTCLASPADFALADLDLFFHRPQLGRAEPGSQPARIADPVPEFSRNLSWIRSGNGCRCNRMGRC